MRQGHALTIASVITITFTAIFSALGFGFVLGQDDASSNDLTIATQIPQHETPNYHCFRGFFALEVGFYADEGDLDPLLVKMGLPTNSKNLKSTILKLVDELSQAKIQGRFSVSDEYADDPTGYQTEQTRMAKQQIAWHKQLYDLLLDVVKDIGEDPERVHKYIIEEGRGMVQVGITGTGEYDEGYKEALQIFEDKGSYNPWLE